MYNIRPHLLSLKQSTVTTYFILFFSSVIPYNEGGCHKQKEKRGNKIYHISYKNIFSMQNIIFPVSCGYAYFLLSTCF